VLRAGGKAAVLIKNGTALRQALRPIHSSRPIQTPLLGCSRNRQAANNASAHTAASIKNVSLNAVRRAGLVLAVSKRKP
jgi:hypothetical protein